MHWSKLPALDGDPERDHLAEFRADRFGFFRRVGQELGDIGQVRTGWLTGAYVNAPAMVQEVLADRSDDYLKSPALYMYMRPMIGNGLLASEDPVHKRARRIVAPAFQAKRVLAYADAIVEETARTLPGWGQRVDIAKEMTALTLRIVSRTLFHSTSEVDGQILEESFSAAGRILIRLMNEPLPILPGPLVESARELKQVVERIDAIVMRVIGERRASGEEKVDVLSMLLGAKDEETGKGLSDPELRDEVLTLFLAGHETTANALTWAWQLLAAHPEVRARLEREVAEVLGERPATYADAEKLSYTLCVFKETLRLYPVVYFTARLAKVDTQIGPWQVPAGTTVFVNFAGLHRRADAFPEPQRFDPDRFKDAADRRWPKGSYLPFGAGPRVCPGNYFAMLEGQLVLATIAQRYRLSRRGKPTKAEALVTLRPKGAVWMNVERSAFAAKAEL